MLLGPSKYPSLKYLVDLQLEVTPTQEKFLRRRLSGLNDVEMQSLEGLASQVRKLVGDNAKAFAEDYDWLCAEQIKEELYFRRNNRYQLSTFQEAFDKVYSNEEYMLSYMNGLLMTQLWWSNHTKVIEYYRDHFLSANPTGYSHLEIGPGHGLFIFLAAADGRSGEVTGWDISKTSIESTAQALKTLGLETSPILILQDMFDHSGQCFDSVVFSEVLEHMENPGEAVEVLGSVLTDNGRCFVNMPINSPAPDHLFNAESPQQLRTFIENHGLKVVNEKYFPATNQTLERALKKKMSINCVFICKKR